MRRMINNTTAIAACLSLLVPHAALAQGAPAGGEQPPVPPVQEQPAAEAAEATAEQQPPAAAEAEPAAEPAAEAEAQPEPAPEAAAAPEAEPEPEPAPAPAPAETAAEPAPAEQAAPEPAPAEAPEAASAPEPAAAPQPEPQAAEAPAEEERPAPAQREQQQERPAQAENRPADQEGKSQRAQERAARQADQEEATREGQAERPAAAARQQQQEPPAEAEAARQQDQERPAAAARDQQAERPQAAPAAGSDPLGEALEAEQNGGAQAADPGDDPAQTQAQDAPAADNAPDEDKLRDALTREQAAPTATSGQAAQGQAAEGQAQPPAAAGQPAGSTQAAAPGDAPEAGVPVTEAARQAAQETAAPTAAALNEDQQGEVVEQQITEENSRSSDEDFATSLRDALAPQGDQQAAQRNDDDDDDNDLAKALLLGLGAVAVGTYLNNNRQVALSAPDRVVVTRPDGSQELIKDEVALLRQPGSTVTTENFDDGSSRTVVSRSDGSRVVTIRDADLRVLRRTLVSADGTQTRLIDDTAPVEPVDVATLPRPAPVAPTGAFQDEAALREALQSEVAIDRRFTLGQIRSIPEVRALVPPVTIDAITFDTGSAAISPDQARQLSTLGNVIQDAIAQNPREMFLIEGHTDTVGADAANLALSDRRAESVALALTEYFDVPPENMVVQGYGEQFLQVRQEGDVRENRRAAVRRITGLLQTAEAQ